MNPAIFQIEGWMSEAELHWLYETAMSLLEGSLIVEIGVWKGRSSAALYEGAGNKKQVVSVDPWEILPGIVNIDDYVEMETTDLFAVYLENMKLLGFNPRPYQPHEYGPQYLVSEAAKAVNLFEDNSVDMFF